MDYWPYFVGPAILVASAVVGVWSRRNIMKQYRSQTQQNATVSTENPSTQETQQSNFAEISSANRERLQKTDDNSMNFNYGLKPQENQQTIIMMPKQSKIQKEPKLFRPSKAHNFNPKEKLPHFCKAPNDGDMIKRY